MLQQIYIVFYRSQVAEAWGLLLHSAAEVGDMEAFQYDLVDIGRQVGGTCPCHLQNRALRPLLVLSAQLS